MKDKLKGAVIAAAAIVALALGGAAIAGAAGGGDDDKTDKAITGQALDRAKAVALDHTGGGKVNGTEVGDEEGAYEVEVTRADGRQVDVHLDKGFNVINSNADGENDSGGDHESGAED
ncbi:MAG: PepSY domain-containing protein [Thermoleophilaceae bacterium]|nr:PepSY domain-containing protein [Thermoleophilaceae bacterium]